MRVIDSDSPTRLDLGRGSLEMGGPRALVFSDLLETPSSRERERGGGWEGEESMQEPDARATAACRAPPAPQATEIEAIRTADAARAEGTKTIEAIADQMLKAVCVHQDAGGTSLRLQIEAPRLRSRVDLRLRLVGGRVEITFLPADPADRQLLQGAVGALEQACTERGLRLDPVSFDAPATMGSADGDRSGQRELASARPRSAARRAREAGAARSSVGLRASGTDYIA